MTFEFLVYAAASHPWPMQWMRKQPGKSPAVPTQAGPQVNGIGAPAPPGASSYSSLVTPVAPTSQGKRDVSRPFSYSREEMLRVWKDGAGSSALPIEVERWEGIVKEEAGEPVCLRELSDVEKQVCARRIFLTSHAMFLTKKMRFGFDARRCTRRR